MPDQPANDCFLSVVVTFLSGGFVGTLLGAFLNHFLSSARDHRGRKHALEDAREARKRSFISFLGGFRSEAERTHPVQFARLFSDRVHRFREESAKIRPGLAKDAQVRFDEAVTSLCRLGLRQVSEVDDGQNYFGRDRVCTAIDTVVRILD
jgi:hypothetical protein